MGLFNANAPVFADVNLLFQIVILVLLLSAVSLARLKRRFKGHGALMGIALFSNTISIAVIMIPSFLSFGGLFSNFSTPAMVVITHAALGLFVEIVGAWLVAMWMVRNRNVKDCVGRKSLMRITSVLWSMELIVGIYVYFMLYVPI